ncbi:DUF3050 domain-containing protein [Maribacter sp. ACAM166]|uniref:DUF3050 domain-containing protein n=1 Tax=Maribacter sp. ACAM166 TaxID=2508996 RepID=UPI0010FD0D91|nr:DUF3050 domain-containing protein [Maribacter sp. ACAM166]TLP77343.1 DUF3050 domain-containing protein [Maribacter sp. ACAM166]
MRIEEIELKLLPLRERLRNHELYEKLNSLSDIKIFMANHVYAVWDFMSLLKGLQRHLTCTNLPWKPVKNANTARFINEIVLEEESDRNEEGIYKSHFEMYLDAMDEVDADTAKVKNFLEYVTAMENVLKGIESSELNKAVKGFLKFTFEVIKTNEPHKIAAAFTFGREELIPDMFLKIIEQAGEEEYPKLGYYLKRHIELDGEDHGPLSLKMINELCGTDERKWEEVAECSEKALEQRIALWDYIALEIKHSSKVLA